MKLIIILIILCFLLIGCNNIENISYKDNITQNNSINNFNNSINNLYGVLINTTALNSTINESRMYFLGYFKGVSYKDIFHMNISNISREYNMPNDFPYEDDCINETHCFVKYVT